MLIRNQPTIDTPERKALYLLAGMGTRIEAGSGHLLLRLTNNPLQRYPASRIARIICNTHALWSGEALKLCFANGIAITWVDAHGHAVGSAQASHPQHPPIAALLETYLELQDWPQRFENWVTHRRHQILIDCAHRAAANQRTLSPEQYRELKRQFIYNGAHPLIFEPQGEGFCHALAVDHLQRAGLQATYWGFDAQAFELASQLASLLWAELNLECGTLPAQTDQHKLVAHLFEAWARQREVRLQHHLCDLKCHMAREVDAWR